MTQDLDEVLGSPAYVTDPYPVYRRLREDHAVYWSGKWRVWVVTRYDDVRALLRDHEHFSNAGRFSAIAQGLPELAREASKPLVDHNSVGMLQSDPPDHTRLRALVRNVFSPRLVAEVEPRVREVVSHVLDQAAGAGTIEVVTELALKLPIAIICGLLGVPGEDEALFAAWSADVSSFQAAGAPEPANIERASRAVQAVERYFDRICVERHDKPGPDLISVMLEAEEHGSRLTHDELINMCVNVLFAGHETTKSLIANATLALICNESQRVRLAEDPGLLKGAVEESLRYESPVQRGWRRVASDFVLHGAEMKEDDVVFMMIGSANRDERQFPSPDVFDIGREKNAHLAFGLGIHACLGAPLARIEAPVAIGELFGRFGKLSLAEPVEWTNNIHIRCPRSLRLEIA